MSDLPARHLDLEGASNFRDLGGYPTADGRVVRWRRIFRSNHLGHLTPADIDVVRGLGVRSAFDFRGRDERAAAVCGVADITVHSLPIEPTVVAALRARLAAGSLSADDALEIMRESYRNYVRLNTHSFRALFGHLLEDRAPLVIHCWAGVSRSTASAFAAACALNPHRDEMEIARKIRAASPVASPNRLIVSLADKALARNGRMLRALNDIGPATMMVQGTPFLLELD